MYDRTKFFDAVRLSLFSGTLTQQQVDGMEALLGEWEGGYAEQDMRWLAYALATTYHETSKKMWPIEEYGKGSGQPYGEVDPKTGEAYYGRGYVQLTWADNYKKADTELDLEGDRSCYYHANNALDPEIAATVLFEGMIEGWFRSGQMLSKYFNEFKDDAFGAREIVNGDKYIKPDWAGGVNIGNLIKDYYGKFCSALATAETEDDEITARYVITVRGKGPFTVTVEEE